MAGLAGIEPPRGGIKIHLSNEFQAHSENGQSKLQQSQQVGSRFQMKIALHGRSRGAKVKFLPGSASEKVEETFG
jgi:hypothetical protein